MATDVPESVDVSDQDQEDNGVESNADDGTTVRVLAADGTIVRVLAADAQRCRSSGYPTGVGRRAAETRCLIRIQSRLTSTLEIDQVVAEAIIMMSELLQAPQGSVIIRDEHQDMWRKVFSRLDRDEREESFVTPQVIDAGLAGSALRTGVPQIVEDITDDDRWFALGTNEPGTRSAVAVPLTHRDHILGVMTLTHPAPYHFKTSSCRS